MVRDQTKYQHMLVFARALPGIRQQVAADLARAGLPREKVIAAVVRLMEQTLARVGNLEYARQNDSFGLTTLKNRHVRLSRGCIELDFRAKSGIHHHSLVSDRKLAQILKRCRDLPGSELFQYIDDDGTRHVVNSEDVNDYLRSISGHEITAKDFRTWAATNLALKALRDLNETRPSKKGVLQMVGQVASQLGNTPTVCRKCYIHPAIIDTYLTGSLRLKWRVTNERTANGLWAIERELIRFLHKQRPQQPEPHSLKATLVKSLKSVKSRSAVGIY
jgi:DNA topoisomerase-1